jgi:aspartate/methionine/tyrosine aminotransferase
MFERTKNLKLSIIKDIELRASTYPDCISLAQGVPSFDTPECIKRRVERALKKGVVAKYSLCPGLPELRELIEISLARENMFYDWQKEIIVTAGSIEAITASILTITTPGDEIIIPDPSYTSYQEVIKLAGCIPIFAPLDEESSWSLNIDSIKNKITQKTKAIFFCNPNNPTGTIFNQEQLRQLGAIAKQNNLFIISDEVYKNFVYDENNFYSLAEDSNLRDRVIRIFSFSKAYAMTGWRIAYLHSDESVISEILKVHDALVTCAPVISQYAAMGALEMGKQEVLKFRQQYLKRRDLICTHLDKTKQVFTYQKPNSSYFVFPKVNINFLNNKINESFSWFFSIDLLQRAQVATVPGIAFGPNGENHIRLNFGRNEEDINRSFDRIEKIFK